MSYTQSDSPYIVDPVLLETYGTPQKGCMTPGTALCTRARSVGMPSGFLTQACSVKEVHGRSRIAWDMLCDAYRDSAA